MTDTAHPRFMTDTTRARETVEKLFDEERLSAEDASRLLALCDEVEALRAKVAAASEVLREWPKTVEEAPGEWVLVTRGIPISGEFGTADGVVYFVSWNNETIGADIMDPGEFFVRVP